MKKTREFKEDRQLNICIWSRKKQVKKCKEESKIARSRKREKGGLKSFVRRM